MANKPLKGIVFPGLEEYTYITTGEMTPEGGEIFCDYEHNRADLHGHAEGEFTYAGWRSHAEGYMTIADSHSHAEGRLTKAVGKGSHAEGRGESLAVLADPNNTSSYFVTSADFDIRQNVVYVTGDATSLILSDDAICFTPIDAKNASYKQTDNKKVVSVELVDGNTKLTFATNFIGANYYPGWNCAEDGIIPAGAKVLKTYFNQAFGDGGHVEGVGNIAGWDEISYDEEGSPIEKMASHAEGYRTKSCGEGSHSEGTGAAALAARAHAEGYYTTASAQNAHAEGIRTTASGNASHAEGRSTTAFGASTHSEGEGTEAQGSQSHAEGLSTIAYGSNSHAEGENTKAIGIASHSEGKGNESKGNYSHVEGLNNISYGIYSHSEGQLTKAGSDGETVDDKGNLIIKDGAHAEGCETIAAGFASHAEGQKTTITSNASASHTEGYNTYTNGTHSHVEGSYSKVNGKYSHAEGRGSIAGDYLRDSENNFVDKDGITTTDITKYVIDATKVPEASHAEGYQTAASGTASHAEGYQTIASGNASHTEGWKTIAEGTYSHAEGCGSEAKGKYAHAEGWRTKAAGQYQHAEGKYNIADIKRDTNGNPILDTEGKEQPANTYAHIVGNGTSDTNRSNAYTLDWRGNAWYAGNISANGAFVLKRGVSYGTQAEFETMSASDDLPDGSFFIVFE